MGRNAAIAAGAVVAVVVAVAAVVAVLDTTVEEPGGPVAEAPTPTPAPAPTDTPEPAPTPAPGDGPLEGPPPEGIDELAAQVAELRGLDIVEPLDARTVPRADLGARFAELAREEVDPEEVAADERLLAALRLIAPDVDLLAVLEAFYSEQVLGMYVTEEQVLYVGADGPELSPAGRTTAAHEITHAIQDQHWDLEGLLGDDPTQSDSALASLALVEGDAVLVQELWAVRHLSSEERGEAQREALDGDADALLQAPRYVREALLFPYQHGPLFVQALVEHGGFEAVDAAFEDLPTSTAEILDPQRYLEGWSPETVELDVEPDGDWEEGSASQLGAFDVGQLFTLLGEQGPALASAWTGGAVRHWQSGGEDAVAFAVRFDGADAAAAACDAVPDWYATVADGAAAGDRTMEGDRDWMAWTCTDEGVQVGLGPDEATAAALGSP